MTTMTPSSTTTTTTTTHRTFTYATTSEWLGRRNGRADAQGAPTLEISTPPEFRGEAGHWSPEQIFVSSVETCLMLTFASLAEKHHLPVEAYYSEAAGTLEHADGHFRFTKITVRPTVIIIDRAATERTLDILRTAARECIVSNSIVAHVEVIPDVELSVSE